MSAAARSSASPPISPIITIALVSGSFSNASRASMWVVAVDTVGGVDVLVRDGARDVLILGIGSMAAVSVEVAARLADQGIGVTVVDPRWVKPWDPAVVDLARDHRLVVCVEDNGRVGGCGSTLLQLLNDEQVEVPYRQHGIPQEFLDHAKRDAILERIGLNAQALARGIVEDVTALDRARDGAEGHPGAESGIHVASPLDRGSLD